MKRLILVISALLLFGALQNAQAGTSVNLSFSFHDALSPYGSWVDTRAYGQCWRPRADYGWRPYSQGHWIYSSYGPMWDSPEPYGWAVYHYGRWVYDDYYGWIWVPGYDWYPSRVSWAYGDDYLGWSPVYPSPGYANVNLWLFIDRGHFGYNNYSNHYLRHDRVRPLFERRVIKTRNSHFRRDELERFVRQPVRLTPVRERTLQADRRNVRLVVPQHREATVLREVSRSHERLQARGRADKNRVEQVKRVETRSNKPVQKFESRQRNFNAPAQKLEKRDNRNDNKTLKSSHSSNRNTTIRKQIQRPQPKIENHKSRNSRSSNTTVRKNTYKPEPKYNLQNSKSRRPETRSFDKNVKRPDTRSFNNNVKKPQPKYEPRSSRNQRPDVRSFRQNTDHRSKSVRSIQKSPSKSSSMKSTRSTKPSQKSSIKTKSRKRPH